MSKYGILAVKEGKDISSTDIRDFILDSDYSMFKIGTVLSGSITISAGQQYGTLTSTHGMGYVPAFLVYVNGQLFPHQNKSYAGTGNIVSKFNYGSPYGVGTTTYVASDLSYLQITATDPDIAAFEGQYLGNPIKSAYRFADVAIGQGQTITEATLTLEHVACLGTADTTFRNYGIDEDDTGPFGDPFGRPKTDAYNNKTQSKLSEWSTFSDNVTAIAQEIVNRPGWASGNHMGFLMEDNNSPNNHLMYTTDPPDTRNFTLKVTLTSSGSVTYNYKIVVFQDRIDF